MKFIDGMLRKWKKAWGERAISRLGYKTNGETSFTLEGTEQ